MMPIFGMKKTRHDRSELTRARDGAEELFPSSVLEKLKVEAQEGVSFEVHEGNSEPKVLEHKNRLMQMLQGHVTCPVCTRMITRARIEDGKIEVTGWCCSTLICGTCKRALILQKKPCPKCNWYMN